MTKTNELEKQANNVNLKYRHEKKALILKVPTPIIMTAKGLIAQQSTVDYTGLIDGGLYIAFDAKMCKSKTSFPLTNIHQHQITYLDLVYELGGIAFLFIQFTELDNTKGYITPIPFVKSYWSGTGRRSIPIKAFKDTWLADINNYLVKIEELKDELLRSKEQP